jgi:hypothetical protein
VAWALYEIARNAEVQSKLAAELEAAGLLWAPGCPGRVMEQYDLATLPYLDQVRGFSGGIEASPVMKRLFKCRLLFE